MQDSPFIYGSTVSQMGFTNRENEISKLRKNLTGGINTIIISPRRWGKSSLVEKVISEIKKKDKNHKTILIDLFSVGSQEEFLEVFAREVIKASSSKWQDWVNTGKTFFKQLIPKFSLGIDPNTDFSLSFDWNEIMKYSDEILNLPEAIAQKKNMKLIICLDEFQNLAEMNNFSPFEKKLRAAWQRHKKVTYCLYGSKRHMMADIFNTPSKPFYRFGDIINLQKISEEKWISFITESFKSTGKNISAENAAFICGLMKNHSWYVQQLSHYTWNITNKKAEKKEVLTAAIELMNANMPLYQREIEIISKTQLNLLKAILSGETKLTSASVMNDFQLGTPRNVSKNKDSLMKNEIIHEVNGNLEMVDPAFELWFRKTFFHEELK